MKIDKSFNSEINIYCLSVSFFEEYIIKTTKKISRTEFLGLAKLDKKQDDLFTWKKYLQSVFQELFKLDVSYSTQILD